jgi:iron transport multicopper oxidase
MFGYVSFFPLRFVSKDTIADSGLLRRCVLTAVLGMLSVVWYSLGGQVTEEEMEREVHEQILAKEKRGKLFGLIKPKNREV